MMDTMIPSFIRLVDWACILCPIFWWTRQVNLTMLTKHLTVEFCQYESTVSAKDSISWAKLVTCFVEYAINASDNAVITGGWMIGESLTWLEPDVIFLQTECDKLLPHLSTNGLTFVWALS